jgi:hypothetical protein
LVLVVALVGLRLRLRVAELLLELELVQLLGGEGRRPKEGLKEVQHLFC